MTELLVPADGPLAEILREGVTVIAGVGGAAGGSTSRGANGPRLPF